MTGWPLTVQVQTSASTQILSSWQCVTYDSGTNQLVMRTTETFVQFVTLHVYAYRCLRLTKLTEASYRYYQIDPMQPSLSNERVTVNENGGLSDVTILCNEAVGVASGQEFQILIKTGNESVAKVTCPYYFLSDYEFTVTSSDGTVTCDSSTSGSIVTCTNQSVVEIQPPTCGQYAFYTAANSLWCVDVVTSGTDTFFSLYNGEQDPATILETDTFFFTCIGVNSNNTQASVTSKHCKKNQDSGTVPRNAVNQEVGSVIALTATSAPCPPCPVLIDPVKGSVSIETDGSLTTATYTCSENYTLSGNSTRICQSDGNWSGTAPSCTCPFQSAPANGTLTVSDDGMTVTYGCDSGTVLIGMPTSSCDVDTNLWSHPAPVCDSCMDLGEFSNGTYVVNSSGLTSYVTYTCDPGTSLNGDQTRTCNQDTTWTTTAPSCVTCPHLTPPESGNVTISTDGQTSVATFSCAVDYSLVGSNTTTCGTSGQWDNQNPTCKCNIPSTPANGTVVLTPDGLTAVYTCDTWFTIDGEAERTCQTDGSGWSSEDPTCVQCEELFAPDNGTLDVRTNGTTTTASFTCMVGSTLSGTSVLTCGTSGLWSDTTPTCSVCEALASPQSGSYTSVSNGTVTSAEYNCDAGSTLSGDSSATCLEDGTWQLATLNTTCVSCATLPITSDGSYNISTNGTTSTATFTCSDGYTLQGETILICQANGTWNQEEPNCLYTGQTEEGSPSSDSNLLPAVIILAVLAAAFAGALGAALWYIRKMKKNQPQSGEHGENDFIEIETPTGFTSSIAPVDHKRHVLDSGHVPFSSMPPSQMTSPRSESLTPRSTSFGSPRLEWAKEATISSIIMTPDQPAPWNKPSKQVTKHKSFTPREGPSTSRSSQKETSRDHRKNSESNGINVVKRSKSVGNEIPKRNDVSNNENGLIPHKPKIKTVSSRSPRKSSSLNNGSDTIPPTSERNQHRRTQVKRANTPVHHVLEVNDPDLCKTPRSNAIATVQ